MNKFKLYVYKSTVYRVLITNYDEGESSNSNLHSTYNEHITFMENDRIQFTFAMSKYVWETTYDSNHYPYTAKVENLRTHLLQIGSKIELIINDQSKYILIITNIKPVVTNDSIYFEYTAQDDVSYSWSRRNIGLSYDTSTYGRIQNIYEIAKEILRLGKIYDWRVRAEEINETSQLAPEEQLINKRITFAIENSNPYNMLIELCNALNANMKINYSRKYISFYQKDKVQFSGYRYRPEINLRSLDVEYNMDEMASILHVSGGVDINNELISLVPPPPTPIMDWWLASGHNSNAQIDWNKLVLFNLKIVDLFSYDDWFTLGNYFDTTLYSRRFNLRAPFYSPYYSVYIRIPYNETYKSWNFELRTGEGSYVTAQTMQENQDVILQYHVRDWSYTDQWEATLTAQPFYIFAIPSEKITTLDQQIRINATAKVIDSIEINAPTDAQIAECNNLGIVLKSFSEKNKQFIEIASKTPSLGNFIYDFSFFVRNKILSQHEYDSLMHIFNVEMAKNNMYLKHYEPLFYQSYSELYLGLSTCENILQNLHAAITHFDVQNEVLYHTESEIANINQLYDSYTSALTQVSNLLNSMYNSSNVSKLLTRESLNMSKPLDQSNAMFDVDLLQNYVHDYLITLSNASQNDLTVSHLYSDELDLNNFTVSCQTMNALRSKCGLSISDPYYRELYIPDDIDYKACKFGYGYINKSGNIQTYTEGGAVPEWMHLDPDFTNKAQYKAILPQLIDDLQSCMLALGNESKLGTQLLKWSLNNQTLWDNVYQNYGHVIFEQRYENTDELDSYSLYNQAITYYEDCKYPSANYSISVVHLTDLELVGVSNLAVGNKIKVYSTELNLNESTPSQENLNAIQFRTNDLIITELGYDLRNMQDMSLNVEQISSYKNILQKLIKSIN